VGSGKSFEGGKAANWLPSGLTSGADRDRRKAKVGDYAEVVRIVRNLVHPARYVEDHYRSRVTAKILRRQFEIEGTGSLNATTRLSESICVKKDLILETAIMRTARRRTATRRRARPR
jgi:hypothetical protein